MNERKPTPVEPVLDEEKMSTIQYLVRNLGPNRSRRRAYATTNRQKTHQERMASMPKKNADEIKAKSRDISKKSRKDQIKQQRVMDKAAKSRKDKAARK